MPGVVAYAQQNKVAYGQNNPVRNQLNYLFDAGELYEKDGFPDSALILYRTGVKLASENKENFDLLSNFYNVIGDLYINHSNYAESIINYEKSLEVAAACGEMQLYMQNLAELGSAYMRAGEVEKALDCYSRARDYGYQYNNPDVLTRSLNSLGDVSRLLGRYDEAIAYHEEALEVFFKATGRRNEYWCCTSLGKNYVLKGDCEKAKEYFSVVLEDSAKNVQVSLAAQAYLNIAICARNSGNFAEAIKNGIAAFELSSTLSDFSLQAAIAQNVSLFYEEAGQHEQALLYYKNFKALSDSIGSAAQGKKLAEIIFNQKEEKLLDEVKRNDQLLEKEKEGRLQEAAIFRNIIIAAVIILLISIIYGFFIFKSLQKNKRQNKIIEEQKEDILNSIRYAKRIQAAILPPDTELAEALPENFLLYKPKDIVAGDFYWLEQADDKVLFAVADCTGHGVPGALVSVVCHNGLGRAVREHGLTDPGKILEKVREIVIAQFEKSLTGVQDGMDIALCTLTGNQLCFAGANNPLWLFRKGTFTELAGSKQPIGKYINSSAFETHSITLEKGDTIYLFSDGYADQFGGNHNVNGKSAGVGKKFKKANIIRLLESIQDLPMKDQRTKIDEVFENWRQGMEQVDDVCVLGVRF